MANLKDLIRYEKLTKVKENPSNPRHISKEKFDKLKQSIKDFPEMLELRPIVIDEKGVALGGNMRLKALKELGVKEAPVIQVNDLTEDQKKQFIIKDNVGYGQWDWDILANEWESEELNEWGLDVWQPDEEDEVQGDGLTPEERKYISKIQSPVYEATREEKPSINELVDVKRVEMLQQRIESADISDEDKRFLKMASQRHLQFNYENIAEYYAHSSLEVKELMEDSALVIIDINKAIEQGYAQLNSDIIEIFKQEVDESNE